MRIYIAGPMTGLPDFNYPAFHEAEKYLLCLYKPYEILNPAKHFGGRQDLPHEVYILRALETIRGVDEVVLLPGWKKSNGVHRELNSVRAEAPSLVLYQPYGERGYRLNQYLKWNDPFLRVWLDGPAPAIPGTTPPADEAARRKALPLCSGVLDYFPDALLAVAHCSKVGNDQHNPGQPLHWAKEKSTDEADALLRHLVDRGTMDTDGVRHSAKVAWRALALLQRELDKEKT